MTEYRTLPVDEAVTWIRAWTDHTWPMSLQEAFTIRDTLGWEPLPNEPEFFTRVADERARNGNALALPARKAGAMLAHDGVVALGQLGNKVVRACQLGRLHDVLNRCGGVGQGDVVAHRSVEQHVFLQHYADLVAQAGRVDDGDVLPVANFWLWRKNKNKTQINAEQR